MTHNNSNKTQLLLSNLIRPLLENQLPDWVEAHWFMTKEEAITLAPKAEIAWVDLYDKNDMSEVISHATNIKWLNSIYAGVDGMPLDLLKERGTVITNGAGINAITIAEYVVMAMLNIAKEYRKVADAQQRREWLQDSPGKIELFEGKVLLLGYGAIGKLIKKRLSAFDMHIDIVRRSPENDNEIGPNDWRDKLSEYDWVILAVPATDETDGMIGVTELTAMKNSASLINIARGSVIDQDALVDALQKRTIHAAHLDVTTPEPLPEDHILWTLDNAHISMHLSGRAQNLMFIRSANRFLENLERYHKSENVEPQVNLELGY